MCTLSSSGNHASHLSPVPQVHFRSFLPERNLVGHMKPRLSCKPTDHMPSLVSLGGLNGPKGPGHRWPSYPNLPPLPEPLRLRTSQICLPSDQSGELISDMSLLTTKSYVVHSAPASHAFLNETHSKGLHSPADFKSDFIPSHFCFLCMFPHCNGGLLRPSHAVHIAHTVDTHREPITEVSHPVKR